MHMCVYYVVHANFRVGAIRGGLRKGPGRLYCVSGGSLGQVVGQVVGQLGVGLIVACLLDTMTYRDIQWYAQATAW